MVLDNQVLYNVSKRPICEESLEKLLSSIEKNRRETNSGGTKIQNS